MRRGTLRHWRMLPIGLLLCLLACIASCAPGADNPREARSGEWQGETGFGSFSFTLCEGGRRITDYRLEYAVGGATQVLAQGGGEEVLIDKEDGFDLSSPEAGVVFTGQFSADGKSASGVWKITAPGGEILSENWAVVR